MGKFLFVVAAVLASFIAAESLVCNSCSFSVFGVCLNSGSTTCTNSTNVCYTGKAVFPSLTSFSGFNNQGCRDPTGCNVTTTSTLLGVNYTTTISCCSSNNCNPTTITSGASSTKMAFSAAATVALLVSVFSMH